MPTMPSFNFLSVVATFQNLSARTHFCQATNKT
jgi:hypothetical protein